MTQARLTGIGPPSDPWGPNRLIFIDLTFLDHQPASLATNEQGLASRLRELNERIGKPAEYEFGQNQKGKATVKIPKPEGSGGGGGGKWQPEPPEHRAQKMAQTMLDAASRIPQDWNNIKFTTACDMVMVAMTEFLGFTRELLGVEAGATDVRPAGPSPASTSHSETVIDSRPGHGLAAGEDPSSVAPVSEQTSGGFDSSSSLPDSSDGDDRSSSPSESAGPGGEASLVDGEASGGSLSGPATPQQLETLVNVYGSKPTVIRRAHALLGFSGGWDELTAEDARRLILHHAGVPS